MSGWHTITEPGPKPGTTRVTVSGPHGSATGIFDWSMVTLKDYQTAYSRFVRGLQREATERHGVIG